MEIGRKGMVGNGHTSRVWKGDGQWILNGQYLNHTGIGHFISDFGMRLPAEQVLWQAGISDLIPQSAIRNRK